MHKNWLIGLFYYEGTLLVGRLVPFWIIVAVIASHGVSMFHNGNVRAQKANEKANRPPQEFTMAGLIEECKLELGSQGIPREDLDTVSEDDLITMCNPDYWLKYVLVDGQGQVIKINDPTTRHYTP